MNSFSTYDKVRLLIQPWRKPEGSINKPILKMMMESVMLYLMMKPGSPEDSLVHRYEPYLQPMILRNIVDVSFVLYLNITNKCYIQINAMPPGVWSYGSQ